jgi:hypothetical protein
MMRQEKFFLEAVAGIILTGFAITYAAATHLGKTGEPRTLPRPVDLDATGSPPPRSSGSSFSPPLAAESPLAVEPEAAAPAILTTPTPPPRAPRPLFTVIGSPPAAPSAVPAPGVLDVGATPPPAPPSEERFPLVPAQPSLTRSSFDDEDLVNRHPVRDEGPIAHSRFDDEDRIDHHPVP